VFGLGSAIGARYGICRVGRVGMLRPTRLELVQCPHYRKINPPISNYCFSCVQRLTDVVIDTDEGIQQSVIRDNPDILRQLIDERIAEMKWKGKF